MKKSQVVILAGGFGTRMSRQFPDTPKPLIPVNNIPILEHLIYECKKYNKLNILIVLHYMPEKIKNYFGDGSKFDVNIQYFVEEIPLGTGGALLAVKHMLQDTFLVLYSDIFSDLNFNEFLKFHRGQNSDISIVVHPNDHPYDSDLVICDSSNKVHKFSSHPHQDSHTKNLVNAAMYLINQSALLDYQYNKKEKFDIAQEMFPSLLKNGCIIAAYKTCEYIKDMGTPKRLTQVEEDIKNGVVNSRKISNKRKAIFLDRDGTINVENGHINKPSDFDLLDQSGDAIRLINKSKFLAICVTNQPVIARGECTFKELEEIHNTMEFKLGLKGAYLDHIYFCPHHTDKGFRGEIEKLKINCDCRKPNPGMLINAVKDFNLNLNECWLIGDSAADIGAASNAGCKSILLKKTTKEKTEMRYKPNQIKTNIYEAVQYILSLN
jgi:D,D-heptose 1,7-bisphosphate phosphatase